MLPFHGKTKLLAWAVPLSELLLPDKLNGDQYGTETGIKAMCRGTNQLTYMNYFVSI